MLLRILHRTRYRYHGAIDMAQHMVHLRPVDTPSQRVLSHELRIDPDPAARSETTDVFGNQRTFFSLQSVHSMLTVEADSLVDTTAPEPLPETAPWRGMAWEQVREHFRYRAHAPFDAASEFLFASPHVPRDDAFTAFARPVFKPGLPALEAARALMERIHGELAYEADSTEVNTPALEALEQGKGVCQDFAHIMLGCLRSLGLPARYVSGYLLTRPPPGKPRLIGADASHAWVSVYVPLPGEEPAGAWFDFDPTNNRCGWGSPGEDYVTLATGRDFSDVSPMRGVIQSGARHTLSVAVTVAPPDELDELEAAEHAQPHR
ncbi:transglutaminase family protein [Hydrogenophaga laconesensis]|uniref:Transglutaminase-like putative cysteine protease n=1 Tax=Hydrogenophaga laconesensis TaxID=1805971 RepID=A0ABU1V922_9BURK|nr:transglutaminase family protein [Hydrogenophaga laconesensis]MDR7093917.1 transglutaminase-like putative cysteine protease [Hydrogenophaga laconesensis]